MKTEVVKVHNHFIESIYNTNLIARKLLFGLIHKININEKLVVTANKKEMCRLMGVNEHNPREIRSALKTLMGKIIEIEDHEKEKWMAFVFITKAITEKDKIIAEFNEEARKYLLELKSKFTILQIANIKPLRSMYSIRMYELCQEWKFKGSFEFTVIELRKILGCEDNTMKYGMFKTRVLETARKELKKNCDICFNYIEIKKLGTRGVEKLKFSVYANNDFSVESKQEDSIPGLEPSEDDKAIQFRKLDIEKQLRERYWQGDFNELLQEACPSVQEKFDAVEYYVKNVLGKDTEYINKNMKPGLIRTRIRNNAEKEWKIKLYDEMLERNKWENYLKAFKEYPGREKMHADAVVVAAENKREICPLEDVLKFPQKLKEMFEVLNKKYADFEKTFKQSLEPYLKG